MALRVEKLRLILEMQNKDLTRGITKSITDLTRLSKATEKNAKAVDKALEIVEKAAKDAGRVQEQSWQRAISAAKKFSLQMEQTARAVELSVFKIRTATAKSIGGLPVAFTALDAKLGRSVQKIKSSVNSARVAIGVLGGAAILAAPIKFAASFEKALANVDTLLVDSAVSVEQYEKQLLKLSVTTSKELIDLTQGLYQTISAGIPAVEGAGGAFEVLEKATRAAEAGLATTEQAVDAFTTVLNAYSDSGLTAAEVSDKLFTTVRIGKTTFPELASSIGRVATVASKFGVGIDEVLSAIAELTKNGLSSDEAVTQLRAAILGLGRPAAGVAAKLKKMGIEVGEAAFRSKGLIGVLREIGEATGGSTDAIAELLPNVRALVGGLVLGGDNIENFATSLGALKQSTGATDAAFAKISKTFAQTFAIFKSQVQSTLVVVGNRILPEVQEAFEKFGRAVSENQEAIADGFEKFADAFFAIGRFIIKFGPAILKFMTAFFLVSRITKAAKALAGFGKQLGAVITKAKAGRTAGAGFTKGFTKGAGTLPKVIGGLLKSPNLIATVISFGLLIGGALIDGISDAVTAGEKRLQKQLEEQIAKSKKLADASAKGLGFADAGEQLGKTERRKAGELIEIGENSPRGTAPSAESLVTVEAAFSEILQQVDGDLETAQRFLAEEISEEVGRLGSQIDRARSVAARETKNIFLLRAKLGAIKDFKSEEADRLGVALDQAEVVLFAQEAKARELAAKVSSLEEAPQQLVDAEQNRREAKSAREAEAKTAAAERSKSDKAAARKKRGQQRANARLKASEAARRSLLRGISTVRLKDAIAAAKREEELAEEVLAAQIKASQASATIARATGASAREIVEIEAKAAEERIDLIKAVEAAQGAAFDATQQLERVQVDERIAAINDLGERAQVSARRNASKLAEISGAVQAKILSVVEAAERKRRKLSADRIDNAQATSEALLQIEIELAKARGEISEDGPRRRGRTTGDVADSANQALAKINTFLAGETNKAEREAASEAAVAATAAQDEAATAGKSARSSGTVQNVAAAAAAAAKAAEALGLAKTAGAAAAVGGGLAAAASGVIGIAVAVDQAVELIGTIGSFLETGLTDFGSKIGASFEQLGDGLEAFPDQIEQFFVVGLPKFLDRFFERLPTVLTTLIAGLVRAIPLAIGALISAIPAIGIGLASVFLSPDFWGTLIKSVLLSVLDVFVEFMTNDFINSLVVGLTELVDKLISALTGGLSDGVGSDAADLVGGDVTEFVGDITGINALRGILSGQGVKKKEIPIIGPLLEEIFHSGGSVSGGSANAAAFMTAAGAPGFQGGGLVEAVGSELRGLFGSSFKDDVPATLQTGEFVLSRQAVSAMGGPRAAEALNRGGAGLSGGLSVNIAGNEGGMEALLRLLISSVTVEAGTAGTGLRQAIVGNDPFVGSQFVRGRT